MKKEFAIDGRMIGPAHPPYIIAEISGNHNHDFNRLIKMIDVAKEAGADAVKLQTYTADSLTIDSQDDRFMLKGGTWDGWNLYKLYEKAHTPWDWHEKAFAHGRAIGITVFSSPFDMAAVDLLESLNAPAYKVASNEFTDWALVEYIASKGKPMIMSTGTSTKKDVADTLDFLKKRGKEDVCILHCVSAYPAKPEDSHLPTITDIAQSFDVIAGFSDHTLGVDVSVAAVMAGACVFEKHFTLDRNDGGPDSSFSLEPQELKALCQSVRAAHAASEGIQYGGDTDLKAKNIFPRCFWTIADIAAGETLGWNNIRSIRSPGGVGIRTREFESVIGSRAAKPMKKHQPVEWGDIESPSRKAKAG